MGDEILDGGPEGTTEPPATPVTTPTEILDGSSPPEPKSWWDGIPSELLTDKVKNLKSVEELVKSYNNANKVISQKGLQYPGEDATPEQWNEWYARTGRPETPDAYQWESPLKDITLKPEYLETIRKKFHSNGLSTKQATEVLNAWAEIAQADILAASAAESAAFEESKQAAIVALRNEFGNAFEAKIKSANKGLNDLGITEVLKNAGLLSDPRIVKAMAKYGETLSEDSIERRSAGTSSGIMEQIKDLEARMNKADLHDHAEYMKLVKQREELYRLAHLQKLT